MKKVRKSKSKIIYRYMSAILLILLVLLGILLVGKKDKNNKEELVLGDNEVASKEVKLVVDDALTITNIGAYSGRYMEDASDEDVSDIMSIVVTNTSEKTLQYAEITLASEGGNYVFPLTTLKPDASMLVLEAGRQPYKADNEYSDVSANNVVFFEEELTTYEEIFEIQPLDGGLNITNISDTDVTGEIVIYFKNRIDDIYFGGITYRGRVEGGLKAGEIRQIMTDNFSESETEVMFITIIEE